MIHSIMDALIVLVWLGSTVGCAVAAVLMRPGGGVDDKNTTDGDADRGREGGGDDHGV